MGGFSAAFEAAAAEVNPSVVPIFSEQVVAPPANAFGAPNDQLRVSGTVTRGYLGLLPQDIDEDLAAATGAAPSRAPEGRSSQTLGLTVQTLTPDIAAQLG